MSATWPSKYGTGYVQGSSGGGEEFFVPFRPNAMPGNPIKMEVLILPIGLVIRSGKRNFELLETGLVIPQTS